MEVIDPSTGLMECRVCGYRANLIQPPDGKRMPPGTWQCPNGCNLDEIKGR